MARWLISLGMVLLMAGCGSEGKSTPNSSAPKTAERTLNVFAAASLTESFNDVAKKFEAKNPGVKVVCNFAGSQQLLAQLQHGAGADVFASASTKEMTAALKDGLVETGKEKVFVRNKLVVIYSKKSAKNVATLADLATPGLMLVVADKAVPVGKYTLDMLEKMAADPTFGADFGKKVQDNIVSREENVKSVLAKVKLGEGDVGVVYATDASRVSVEEIGILEVPQSFNQVASYPIATLKSSKQTDLADSFIKFLLSPDGQKIMGSYGFAAGGE